jgi:hypothetical protein
VQHDRIRGWQKENKGQHMSLMTCPDCGNPVSTEAVSCPKCGRPTASRPEASKVEGKTARTPTGNWIGGLLGGVAVVFLIGYCANQADQSSTSTTTTATSTGISSQSTSTVGEAPAPGAAPEREVKTFTAAQLYAMFHSNEVSANQKIGNAIVTFTGTVTRIEQSDFSKTPELDISADDGNEFDDFRADLKQSELSKAAGLVKGETVTLQCDKVSMPVDVYAEDCVIVKKAGVPKGIRDREATEAIQQKYQQCLSDSGGSIDANYKCANAAEGITSALERSAPDSDSSAASGVRDPGGSTAP